MKIANGCNAAEIFPGVFNNCKVAVKRVAKHVSKPEMEMAHFLSTKNVQAKHLLQHISVLEDTYFAYFVSPLCEYNLMELIENKDFPERKGLKENRRLEICQELLQGLQELHSYGILHRNLKPKNILFDINNKLYIADFGASRKLNLALTTLLAQMPWSSYEDVGGMQYKYKKESDIQVAGCLVHYILTDGQHPYQTTTPYSKDPVGLSLNVRMGNFTLQCEERWTRQKDIISRMLSKSIEERPTIEECLQSFTCFIHQSGTTNNNSNVNENEDRTHTADCCPQTSDEMDILESTDSDKPESVFCGVMDSSSHTEEELYESEMGSLTLEMSEEEEEEEEIKKAEGQVAEGIRRKPLKKTWMEIDESANDCSYQQHNITVKMSSNSVHQRIYDKKNYCLYCEKPYLKIARHLKQKHSEKVEVAKALGHIRGSTMRTLLLSKVRNLGNFHHNSSVLSSGKGEIVPKRQATCESTAMDYFPCMFCFAMYVKTALWRHHKRCKLRVKENMPVE
ncbi:probable serine/threonine-protein kinase nek2 [Pimephales promelas]|uniref:probable serine/threonine-protein kinase nek2 n=1 Tax=Pimephales promelas TaxID=90988 RepID=UPI00195552F6|nr:probable serine/threonine-protein kinase nek2 [Pimephales promelas]